LKRLLTLAACAALPVSLLLACSPQKPAEPASLAKYNVEALDVKHFMAQVVDPNSDALWAASGTSDTAKGVVENYPTTDAGWELMQSQAAVLIEAGNALQLPGRPRAPEADFDKFAQQLTAQAILVKAAVDKKDKQGIYDEGAKLYLVCVACHAEYLIGPLVKNGGRPAGTLPEWPTDTAAKQKSYIAVHGPDAPVAKVPQLDGDNIPK
jgi:mono/diheme cytochrome c family protein